MVITRLPVALQNAVTLVWRQVLSPGTPAVRLAKIASISPRFWPNLPPNSASTDQTRRWRGHVGSISARSQRSHLSIWPTSSTARALAAIATMRQPPGGAFLADLGQQPGRWRHSCPAASPPRSPLFASTRRCSGGVSTTPGATPNQAQLAVPAASPPCVMLVQARLAGLCRLAVVNS
jgi:hypothetical protein